MTARSHSKLAKAMSGPPLPATPNLDGIKPSILFKNLLIIAACAFINKAGSAGTLLFAVYACILCIRSSEGAIKAISLTLLVVVCNEAFVPKSTVLTPLRFGIWILASARLLMDVHHAGRLNIALGKPYVLALTLFTGLSLAFSFMGGYYVHISALKLFSFYVGACAILIGTDELRVRGSELIAWFYSIIIFSVCLGGLAYVTGQGYNAKLEGISFYAGLFNGPFYHPQTLGPAAAMMFTFVLCIVLFTPYRHRWTGYPVLVILLIFVYMTRSRTGFIALAAGTLVAFGCAFWFTNSKIAVIRLNVSKVGVLAAMIVGLIGLVLAEVGGDGAVSSKFSSLVLKQMGDKSDKVGISDLNMDQIAYSRQGQIDSSLHLIKMFPVTGSGFGVGRSQTFVDNATWFSAPTEKGFLPLAVIEENGFVGAAVFWLFIALLYKHLLTDRNIPGICGLSVLLAANLGEMMFFGLGGHGGFIWTILGACLVLGPRCIQGGPHPVRMPRRFIGLRQRPVQARRPGWRPVG